MIRIVGAQECGAIEDNSSNGVRPKIKLIIKEEK
jgi:hypothetical protein